MAVRVTWKFKHLALGSVNDFMVPRIHRCCHEPVHLENGEGQQGDQRICARSSSFYRFKQFHGKVGSNSDPKWDGIQVRYTVSK